MQVTGYARKECRGHGSFGRFDVSGVEVMGDEDVGDIGDGADEVLVGAVPVDEPCPSGRAELVERAAGDELERGFEVFDSVAAGGDTAGAKAADELSVDEEVLDEVEAHSPGLGLGGVLFG